MTVDAHTPSHFYATQRGTVAHGLLAARLARAWPSVKGLSILGLGYAAPYLPTWADTARSCIAANPAPVRAIPWPPGAPNLTCTTEEDSLPFPDLCFDRILLVHGIEAVDNARALLREVWRVLKDDGRLLVVAPNRRGLWAHVENTPFGHGQPYSPGQIGRLLAANLFRVEQRDTALHVPPINWRLGLPSARAWESGGRWLAPQLAGVTITGAVKDLYAAIPVKRARRRMVLSKAA